MLFMFGNKNARIKLQTIGKDFHSLKCFICKRLPTYWALGNAYKNRCRSSDEFTTRDKEKINRYNLTVKNHYA